MWSVCFVISKGYLEDHMFHIKDHKTYDLFDPYPHFGPKRRTLLENSWAKIFREDILPILPVHLLRDHFHDTQGRPSKELFTMLGLMVIQQNEDMTDEETVFQVAFNELWHYALDIRNTSDDSTYVCRKSLWNMRNRLIKYNLYDSIFDSIANQLTKICEVDTSKQRLDSMHIKSNMRHLGRIGLFISTIKGFLYNLKRQHKNLYTSIEQELLDRYFSKRGESAFAMVKPSAAGKTLEILAQDLLSLVERFRLIEKVCGMNTYQLLVRLLKEQCQVEEDSISSAKKVTVKSNKEVPSDSLQNPSDPDAGYSGHKGKGYQVQIMETYSPEEKKDDKRLSLITYVEVEPANESDANALLPAIKDTKKRNLAPEEVLVDSLYGSDDNNEKAQGEGVEVIAPTMGRAGNDKITLSDFALTETGAVHSCPEGNCPESTKHKKKKGRHTAIFSLDCCLNCCRFECCPVKRGKKDCRLGYYDKAARVAKRKAFERTDEFRDKYRYRAGVEATNSQLDRKTGVKRLRVRGLNAVRFAAKLKAAGLNILRATAFKNRRKAKENNVEGVPFSVFALVDHVRQIFKEQLNILYYVFVKFFSQASSNENYYQLAAF
jgi:hypothetical protein